MIKTIKINAKCSDCCYAEIIDENGVVVGERDYYPPRLGGVMGGDDVDLTIDVESGRILNWVPPSQDEIMREFERFMVKQED